MKRVETALEKADYNTFEKVCSEQDISMRKKTKQLILSFLESVGKKNKKTAKRNVKSKG